MLLAFMRPADRMLQPRHMVMEASIDRDDGESDCFLNLLKLSSLEWERMNSSAPGSPQKTSREFS